MFIDSTPSDDRVNVALPRDVFVELELAGREHGLSPAGYIALIHAIHQRQVRPDLASCVREIFTHDRAILKELAG